MNRISKGIRARYGKVAETYTHKEESFPKGREYAEYTHYIERLQQIVAGRTAPHGEAAHKRHGQPRHGQSN